MAIGPGACVSKDMKACVCMRVGTGYYRPACSKQPTQQALGQATEHAYKRYRRRAWAGEQALQGRGEQAAVAPQVAPVPHQRAARALQQLVRRQRRQHRAHLHTPARSGLCAVQILQLENYQGRLLKLQTIWRCLCMQHMRLIRCGTEARLSTCILAVTASSGLLCLVSAQYVQSQCACARCAPARCPR